MTIWRAAELVAEPGDTDGARLYCDLLVRAAQAGAVVAEPVSETAALPMLVAGGSNRARRLVDTTPKTISPSSPIDIEDACAWLAGQGHELPERVLKFLNPAARGRAVGARKAVTAQTVHDQKALAALGLVVWARAGVRHGERPNLSRLTEEVMTLISDETTGEPPHGWRKSTIMAMLGRAVENAEALLPPSKRPRSDSASSK
jgi:hypothetical protein